MADENANFLDCINKEYVTNDDLLKAIAGQVAGLAGLRLVEVEVTGEDFVDCYTNVQTVEDLFRNIITVDDCGNPALRVGIETASDPLPEDCCEALPECKNPEMTFEILFKRLLGKGADGKPFLRLCSFKKKV